MDEDQKANIAAQVEEFVTGLTGNDLDLMIEVLEMVIEANRSDPDDDLS